MYFETYCDDIRRGINRGEWYEYALSSGLMIVLIAMLFGCRGSSASLLLHTRGKCVHEPLWSVDGGRGISTAINCYSGSVASRPVAVDRAVMYFRRREL